MQLSDDFFQRWEHIISGVEDKSVVPLEFIEKIIIRYDGRRRKTVNFHTLRKQGLDLSEIEILIHRQLESLGDTLNDLEFIVDVHAVAQIIQPETNKILSKL